MLDRLQEMTARLGDVMLADRHRVRRRARAIEGALRDSSGRHARDAAEQIERLEAEVRRSVERRTRRAARRPRPTYPPELPVSGRRDEIAKAIAAHQVVVVCGETGSGKTTQIPKICLELGRGVAGMIGHTQPRRIAARTVAGRIAEELGSPLGQEVGYKIRFGDKTGPDTFIKVMTDGILLAETQGDRFLDHYDTIIIDEAHERSLNIDFLLGYLRQLLPKRPELKIVITSATIDPQRFAVHFADAATGKPAPIVEVSGRTYPVDIHYRPVVREDEEADERDMEDAILAAVDELAGCGPGDVLVFLSGEREIRQIAEALRKHHPPSTEVLPLYARLTAEEQMRVFRPHQGRRIVLATNVAETSLTVPGIRYVVDPGFARISRYGHRTKVQRLPIEAISRASADQRAGRCGRVAPGVCIRLYEEQDYLARERFTEPEILRTNLASVILQMKSLRLGEVEQFPFVEPPDARMIRDGYETLFELGAIDGSGTLTKLGAQLARLPIDPRIGRMVLAAQEENCLREVLVIAAALEIQDPRERPMDKQDAADTAHRRFLHEESDFLALLNLWNFYHEQAGHLSQSKLRKLCRENFLSYVRMREWHDVHQQLHALVADMGFQVSVPRAAGLAAARGSGSAGTGIAQSGEARGTYDAVHRALLAGLLSNVGTRTETFEYQAARGTRFHIFPASGLFKKGPRWVVAAEVVETTKMYARTVAKIDAPWIERVGGHVIKRSHSDPHWSKDAGQVAAFERGSLFGLEVYARRRVHYGPIDPAKSRELFIHHALLGGEIRGVPPAFLKHNQEVLAQARKLEAKARRGDIVAEAEALFAFYDARLPPDVYSIATLEQWLKRGAAREDEASGMGRSSAPPGQGSGARGVHGFRSPSATSTRGYNPAPLRGEDAADRSALATGGAGAGRVSAPVAGSAGAGRVSAPVAGSAGAGRVSAPGAGSAGAGHAPGAGGGGSRTQPSTPDEFLRMTMADAMRGSAEDVTPDRFPDSVPVAGARLNLEYRLEPGEPADGVTMTIPIEALAQFDDSRVEWLVPGLLKDKIVALMRCLPKAQRKLLDPIPELAAHCAASMPFGEGDLYERLSAKVKELKGVTIPRESWQPKSIPEPFRLNLVVADERGRQMAAGRDLAAIRQQLGPKIKATFAKLAGAGLERDGITTWDFGDLEERVERRCGAMTLVGYPAIEDRGAAVAIRVLQTPGAAEAATRGGLRRLFALECRDELAYQLRVVPDLPRLVLLFAPFGKSEDLKRGLIDAAVDRVFVTGRPLVRSRSQYDARVREGWDRIAPAMREIAGLATEILEGRQALALRLGERMAEAWGPAVADIREQASLLLPREFLTRLPFERLAMLPRYLAGARMRLDKLRQAGPARDTRCMAELTPHWRRWVDRMRGGATANGDDAELDAYRWMLEEFRVSLFAQELGTAGPVSAKRLEEQWGRLAEPSGQAGAVPDR